MDIEKNIIDKISIILEKRHKNYFLPKLKKILDKKNKNDKNNNKKYEVILKFTYDKIISYGKKYKYDIDFFDILIIEIISLSNYSYDEIKKIYKSYKQLFGD